MCVCVCVCVCVCGSYDPLSRVVHVCVCRCLQPSFLKVDYEKWRDEDDSGDEETRLKHEVLHILVQCGYGSHVIDV